MSETGGSRLRGCLQEDAQKRVLVGKSLAERAPYTAAFVSRAMRLDFAVVWVSGMRLSAFDRLGIGLAACFTVAWGSCGSWSLYVLGYIGILGVAWAVTARGGGQTSRGCLGIGDSGTGVSWQLPRTHSRQ